MYFKTLAEYEAEINRVQQLIDNTDSEILRAVYIRHIKRVRREARKLRKRGTGR